MFLLLIKVEIKVSKHLPCLFLVPLHTSQLLPCLLQISSSFTVIFLLFSVRFRKGRRRMQSAMRTSLPFSPRSNPSLQHLEITYPLLDLCHMHPILSCSYPLCCSNNFSNFVFIINMKILFKRSLFVCDIDQEAFTYCNSALRIIISSQVVDYNLDLDT